MFVILSPSTKLNASIKFDLPAIYGKQYSKSTQTTTKSDLVA